MSEEKTSKNCFNCGFGLSEGLNYCPNCGQKVDRNNLRLRVVLKEFFENYISFDTQFGRSIIPFLFRPGYLTTKFNEGRRKNFANPFRLYILMSIFFFFIITKIVVKEKEQAGADPLPEIELRGFYDLPSDEQSKLNEHLSSIIIMRLNDSAYIDSSFAVAFDHLSDYKKNRVTRILSDSVQMDLGIPADSTYQDARSGVNFGAGTGGFGLRIEDFNFKQVKKYAYNKDYTDRQILDSMDVGEIDARTEFVYLQIIKTWRAGEVSVNRFIIKNMSFALFLIIPFAAIFFFMFYYKRKKFYVEHLIHSIHIHSFVLLIYGLMFLLSSTIDSLEPHRSKLLFVAFLISVVYIFRSLQNVYGEKLKRTLLKFISLSILYWFFFFFIVVAEAIISFLLF